MQPIKTDNKYKNSKIYTIRSYQMEKYYIGSTTQPLHKRLYDHKSNYKSYQNQKKNYVTSFEVIKYDDCYIELLEEINCDNKEELIKREGEWIRANLNDVVNKKIEGKTLKEYRVDNADKIKQYRIDNADKIKQYYIDNIDKINAVKKVKFICECGGKFTNTNKAQHFKSKKHTNYTNSP